MVEMVPPAQARPEVERLTIRPPQHRVDRRFILWRTLQALLWGIAVLGTLAAVYWFEESTRRWLSPVLVIGGAIYAVNIAVMPTWRYLVHRWETTDDAVYALEGWLTKKWQIVPISRIQSIDTQAGIIQQLLGLATITVTTASAEGKVTIEGIDATIAQQTVERLKDITAATQGDAT
jgi:membrane protein YdbS with pleckstrin-like domain